MDIGESGTGPRSRSSSVLRVCFIRCKKFKGNFTMALCSFGGVSDQCGATAWAPHETGMVPLLSCENDMTEWLKQKYKGSGASGTRGRPGHIKRNIKISVRDHTRAQMAFIAIQWTLFY